MTLPNVECTVVPKAKITDYLLCFTHRDGQGKAGFFTHFGFSAEAWEDLAQALVHHATENEVTQTEDSPFGTRYVIEGEMNAANGRVIAIRSVWFIETGDQTPRFVTAYPL